MNERSRSRWWQRFGGRASGGGHVYQAGGNITINPAVVEPPGGPVGRLWNAAGAVATFTARELELAAVPAAVSGNPGVPVVAPRAATPVSSRAKVRWPRTSHQNEETGSGSLQSMMMSPTRLVMWRIVGRRAPTLGHRPTVPTAHRGGPG
ncbi:hypothetical protein Areg01_85840 [Actinoplanes regularis]|nr:hypothetical protein Areg01_85840 [Actinoplanes regularis]